MEKELATHSSTPAWKIPWTAEAGRLQSTGSLRDTTERLHFHLYFPALEQEMATHSSVLAWRIPGMGEPMGSHRVGHDCSDLAAAAARLPGRGRARPPKNLAIVAGNTLTHTEQTRPLSHPDVPRRSRNSPTACALSA